jgi:hypothetical protein
MSTLHVEPRNGLWVVRPENRSLPLSQHGDAATATLAACRTEDARVLVHDRYHRVHVARPARRFSRAEPDSR